MALPTKAKTWVIDPCNLVAYTSTVQSLGDTLLAIKNSLLTTLGVTVKGSCNGTTGAMDGVDRWSTSANVQTRGTNATTAQSWIVLDFANMGGAELLITHLGSSAGRFEICMSPGGNYVIAGTSTHKPTATDELTTLNSSGEFINLFDHRWTTWIASDGSALYFGIASRGSWQGMFGMQIITSRMTSGTFSPAVAMFRFSTTTGGGTLSSWATNCVFCRLDPGSGSVNITAGTFGSEASCGSGTNIISANYPNPSDLQGGEHFVLPVHFWSDTNNARGAVGTFIDLWAGNTSAVDGDTYPATGTRLFIQCQDMILPWDGSLVLMD